MQRWREAYGASVGIYQTREQLPAHVMRAKAESARQWYNHYHSMLKPGISALRINFDETAICIAQHSKKGNKILRSFPHKLSERTDSQACQNKGSADMLRTPLVYTATIGRKIYHTSKNCIASQTHKYTYAHIHIRGIRRRFGSNAKRSYLNHVAFVCDDEDVQRVLPQVVIGNMHILKVGELKALRDALPARMTLLRAVSSWTNGGTCKI